MASDAVPSRPRGGESVDPVVTQAALIRILRDVLVRLASLKIAVTLFSMGIFVILVGTLAQARVDVERW